jgi:hypothetical protein
MLLTRPDPSSVRQASDRHLGAGRMQRILHERTRLGDREKVPKWEAAGMWTPLQTVPKVGGTYSHMTHTTLLIYIYDHVVMCTVWIYIRVSSNEKREKKRRNFTHE